ncbi:MAG: BlaI/MecI/CopY family transcriptional regulator [Bacteroidota bacterium]
MEANKPSDAELEILQILWAKQPCTVRVVHETLAQKKEVGYTTTLKQMQRMLEKGLVQRSPGKGKSHVYAAVTSAEETKGKLFNKLVDNVFGSSIKDVVMHALGKGNPSSDEIEAIKRFLDEMDKS